MKSTWILAVSSALLAFAVLATASETDSAINNDAALQKLMEGNARFVSGNSTHSHQSAAERRAELLTSQHPIAVVVGCSDSRTPPEIVFEGVLFSNVRHFFFLDLPALILLFKQHQVTFAHIPPLDLIHVH